MYKYCGIEVTSLFVKLNCCFQVHIAFLQTKILFNILRATIYSICNICMVKMRNLYSKHRHWIHILKKQNVSWALYILAGCKISIVFAFPWQIVTAINIVSILTTLHGFNKFLLATSISMFKLRLVVTVI